MHRKCAQRTKLVAYQRMVVRSAHQSTAVRPALVNVPALLWTLARFLQSGVYALSAGLVRLHHS